jgi:serine/threonine protein kinase
MSKLIGGKVIGAGTYGCVHKPQMECREDDLKTSPDAVSKIMLIDEADAELKEFGVVAAADPRQTIHLGTPTKCAVKNTDKNIDAIESCNNSGLTHTTFLPRDIYKFALLVMKDGGQDLQRFGNVISNLDNTPPNQNVMELFWLEVSRLFYGLKVFKAAGLVHHDINHNNIVYNIDTNRLNFIDFGLMTKPKDIVESARAGKYNYPPWWSFPWEISDFNYKNYKTHLNANYSHEPRMIPVIPNTYDYFFRVILPIDARPDEVTRIKNEMSNKYYSQTTSYATTNYAKCLNQSIDTMDSYGVGLALLYILNRSRKLIPSELGEMLNALFTNMISPLVYERLAVDTLIDEYNTIMTESGLLEKHNKYYDENFLLVNNDEHPPAPEEQLPQTPIESGEPSPAPENDLPGGRFRPRSRKSSKMSKTTRHRKSSKRVRSRKANKAKRSNRKH